MRPLRHLPQLPQRAVSCSNVGGADLFIGVLVHLGRTGVLHPLRNLLMTEAPLASDFDGGDYLAFGPEANGSGGNAEPLCDSGGC